MEVWIGRAGERHGPYQEEDVRQWLRSGEVGRDDLGWYEGLADWQPLSVLFPDAIANAPAWPPAVPPLPQAADTRAVASLEDYAGFGKRFLAWLIDFLILLLPGMLISSVLGDSSAGERLLQQIQSGADAYTAYSQYLNAAFPAELAVAVLHLVYYSLFESSAWQATPGKFALRIRVTDLDGKRLGRGRALGRNLARLLNQLSLGIGYLMIAWTRRRQGLHDLLANTLVLNGRADAQQAPSNPRRNDGNGSLSA